MATYVGFNTINQYKKFTLTDAELIQRDLLNALNIQQGQLPGRPQYGTTVWSFMFENQSQETNQAVLQELQRVVAGDPRISIIDGRVYGQDNGLLIELDVIIVPSSEATVLSLFFNQETQVASLV